MNRTPQFDSANKLAQHSAAITRAAIGNAALATRDVAAPVVEHCAFQVKRAAIFVAAFVRTLAGR